MTDEQFTALMTSLVDKIRADTPVDTSNLQKHATKGDPIGGDAFVITVDIKIAPYFPAVNYRKNFASGKPNKNYHYFENSFRAHLEEIAESIGGVIEYE